MRENLRGLLSRFTKMAVIDIPTLILRISGGSANLERKTRLFSLPHSGEGEDGVQPLKVANFL